MTARHLIVASLCWGTILSAASAAHSEALCIAYADIYPAPGGQQQAREGQECSAEAKASGTSMDGSTIRQHAALAKASVDVTRGLFTVKATNSLGYSEAFVSLEDYLTIDSTSPAQALLQSTLQGTVGPTGYFYYEFLVRNPLGEGAAGYIQYLDGKHYGIPSDYDALTLDATYNPRNGTLSMPINLQPGENRIFVSTHLSTQNNASFDNGIGLSLKLPAQAALKNPAGGFLTQPHEPFEGGVVAAVPEPETWASMIVGTGLAGFAARRRTRRKQAGL
jgi:hypothetical protein